MFGPKTLPYRATHRSNSLMYDGQAEHPVPPAAGAGEDDSLAAGSHPQRPLLTVNESVVPIRKPFAVAVAVAGADDAADTDVARSDCSTDLPSASFGSTRPTVKPTVCARTWATADAPPSCCSNRGDCVAVAGAAVLRTCETMHDAHPENHSQRNPRRSYLLVDCYHH